MSQFQSDVLVLIYDALLIFIESSKPWYSKGEDKVEWLRIDTNRIPTGIVEVDVLINDNGIKHESVMFAGHMGTEIKDGGHTVQPTLGWAIALKPKSNEKW